MEDSSHEIEHVPTDGPFKKVPERQKWATNCGAPQNAHVAASRLHEVAYESKSGHLASRCRLWCRGADSNRRPSHYE